MGNCCATKRSDEKREEEGSDKAQTAEPSEISMAYKKLPPEVSPSLPADHPNVEPEDNLESSPKQVEVAVQPATPPRRAGAMTHGNSRRCQLQTHTLLQLSELSDANLSRHTRHGSLRKRPPSIHEPKFLSQSGTATPTGLRSATLPVGGQIPRSSSLKGIRSGNRANAGLYARTVDANALRRTLSNGMHNDSSEKPCFLEELQSDGAQISTVSNHPPSTSSSPAYHPGPGTPNSLTILTGDQDNEDALSAAEELSFGQPAVLDVTSDSHINRPGSVGQGSYQSSLGYGPGQYVEQHLVGTSTFGDLELGFQVRGQSNAMLAIDVRSGQNLVFRYKPSQLPEIYVKCYMQTDDPSKVSKKKTKQVPGIPHPHFDEVIVFSGDFHNKLLKVMVWEDHGVLGRNCMLGEIIVDLAILSQDLRPGVEVSGWYSLFAPYSSEHQLSASESFASLLSSESSPTPSRVLHRGSSKKKFGLKPKKIR